MEFGKTPQSVPGSKSWETTITKVDSWPEAARPLSESQGWVSWLYSAADVFLVVLPLCFIGQFSMLVCSIDQAY